MCNKRQDESINNQPIPLTYYIRNRSAFCIQPALEIVKYLLFLILGPLLRTFLFLFNRRNSLVCPADTNNAVIKFTAFFFRLEITSRMRVGYIRLINNILSLCCCFFFWSTGVL